MMTGATRFQRIFLVILLVFLSILSISGTIALRNVLHAIMLCMIGWALLFARQHLREVPIDLARRVPTVVYAWCVFLILFPFFADESSVAWSNLRGQWGESILTWGLALGAVLVLGRGCLSLWTLSLVSAAPVFLHLVLTLMAWTGVLRPVFYTDPSLLTLWFSIAELLENPSLLDWTIRTFPMGFRGIEPMHGNIGYPATQSIALALASAAISMHRRTVRVFVLSVFLVGVSFVSVVIAESRGAVYFSVVLFSMYFLVLLMLRDKIGVKKIENTGNGLVFVIGAAVVAGVVIGFLLYVNRSDVRWGSMWDKMEVGFNMNNPVNIICNDLSMDDIDEVRRAYEGGGEGYVDLLVAGIRDGDGARILMQRAGFELILRFPWGLDGSREGYQKRIAQVCGHAPALVFSHAHNAWINLILAVGWIGAFLYASVLLAFTYQGLMWLRDDRMRGAGMGLLLLSVFWVLRGLVDAVYQEHYLQMQAFFLLYLYLMLPSTNSSTTLRRSADQKLD